MDLRIRYLVRFIQAFLSRFKAIIIIGIIFGLTLFLLINKLGPKYLTRHREIIAVTGKYQPENMPTNLQVLISQGLTKVNKANEIEPDLAKKWETPDRGKTWIFHLKENSKWQDKSLLTSEDINYHFNDATIERPNKSTIIFKLKNNFSPFPSIVTRPVFKKGLLGTGKWRVVKMSLTGGYLDKLVLKNALGESKTFIFYPTEEAAKLAYKLGKVDTLKDIYNPTPLNEWKTNNISSTVATDQVVTIFLNLNSPTLKDKNLRQALNYAINKDTSNLSRALSPIAPTSWVYNPQVKPYNYDQEKAKETVQEAVKASGNDINLNLITSPSLLSLAEKIANDWNNTGIKTKVLVSSIIPNDFEAYLAILDIPKDPDQYFLWHSTQGSNITNYNSPRIDKLLEDGRAAFNISERKNIYLDFQRFLVEDCPAIFLYHPETFTITRK